jgi:putative membrane protein
VPAALAAATVLAQIVYPLVHGAARNRLTVLTVLLFAAASISHAAVTRGPGFAAGLLAIAAGIGFAAEAVGANTGVPFGHYSYAGTLGVRLLGVPLVIPLAWTMMAYPAVLVGQRVASPFPARVLVSALALAAWDVFLDPQMVDAGHWRFASGDRLRLNDIPLQNFAGWVLVALVLMAVLHGVLPRSVAADRGRITDAVPYGMYLWTYASSLLANLAFFGRPGVALAGGLVMGLPVLLLLRALRR